MKRSRRSGCEIDIASPDRTVGLKLFRKLVLSTCELSHATRYDVPSHGSRWFMPTLDATVSVFCPFALTRKLDGGSVWLVRCTVGEGGGLKAPAAGPPRGSLMRGWSRSAASVVLFSTAIFTASSA